SATVMEEGVGIVSAALSVAGSSAGWPPRSHAAASVAARSIGTTVRSRRRTIRLPLISGLLSAWGKRLGLGAIMSGCAARGQGAPVEPLRLPARRLEGAPGPLGVRFATDRSLPASGSRRAPPGATETPARADQRPLPRPRPHPHPGPIIPDMMLLTPHDFLVELHARGADLVRRVVFRDTRSTIFSLTRYGRVLNLNAAFAAAPPALLDAFAVVAKTGAGRTRRYDRAVNAIRNWPPLVEALEHARARHAANGGRRVGPGPAPCCGTPEQQAYLRDLYARLNPACFGGRRPPDIRIRLSNRMRRRLGQIRYDDAGPERAVLEIALNVDLMLRANDEHRIET